MPIDKTVVQTILNDLADVDSRVDAGPDGVEIIDHH
jgi:hypothetical protein